MTEYELLLKMVQAMERLAIAMEHTEANIDRMARSLERLTEHTELTSNALSKSFELLIPEGRS